MPFKNYGSDAPSATFGISGSGAPAATSLFNGPSSTADKVPSLDPPHDMAKRPFITYPLSSDHNLRSKSPPKKSPSRDERSKSPPPSGQRATPLHDFAGFEHSSIYIPGANRFRNAKMDAGLGVGLASSMPELEEFSYPSKKRPALSDNHLSKLPKHTVEYDDDAQQGLRSKPKTSLPAQDARVRPSLAQDQTPRLFASAIEQFRPSNDEKHISVLLDPQKDELAKGRRLRRFNAGADTVAKPPLKTGYSLKQTVEEPSILKRTFQAKKLPDMELQSTRDPNLDCLMEPEGPENLAERDLQSAEAILGNCPDMCPESERMERERKGDLDKLERVNGDRNQTSKDYAVKKYSRTAEKDAALIRPLSVLAMTMEHLLHLLSQGYSEELLGLHSFLWDRMRAVRMDLRMQHIFNQQAVTMHEQMIRFHIVAMHELCEYSKGEGFTEGFDAHLNIEQMNKASVDLFHMYDDLRKSGNACDSEAEFRGYYALLKLDKHPGYMVEPVELSLDLAKMSSDMRSTTEVQFAREVARACRLGNYLGFFRLAKSATYLQACLMHAHFSKLRSQAMASLHSGLQKNQGIPMVQVEEWLAMEGEDIEALVEYHGFSVKIYEALYMVKEGPFLNIGRDFKTGRSKLVEEKRSPTIRADVLSSSKKKRLGSPTFERVASLRRPSEAQIAGVPITDEEMPDYEEDEQQTVGIADVRSFKDQKENPLYGADSGLQMLSVPAPDVTGFGSVPEAFCFPDTTERANGGGENLWMGKKTNSSASRGEEEVFFLLEPNKHLIAAREKQPARIFENSIITVESNAVHRVEEDGSKPGEVYVKADGWKRGSAGLQAEADRAKVRILLRSWRARAISKAEEREWRLQKLEAALSSFHLGLPMQPNKEVLHHTQSIPGSLSWPVQLNLEEIERSRTYKLENLWTKLDVGSLVAPILKQKNPSRRLLWWKLLLCSGVGDLDTSVDRNNGKQHIASEWLRAKIYDDKTPGATENEGFLRTVILQKLVFTPADEGVNNEFKFFYIAKDVICKDAKQDQEELSRGTSGLLFLLHEGRSMIEEQMRLRIFVDTVCLGMQLPLLILHTHASESQEAIENLLDLNNLDKSKVACWSILAITENHQGVQSSRYLNSLNFKDLLCLSQKQAAELVGFFDETMLRRGICWLASRAPSQANFRYLHVQDLVLEYLQPSMKALLSIRPTEVSPHMCVQAFNDALLGAASEISNAAVSVYHHGYPDELREMEADMMEYAWQLQFPSWSEATNVQGVLDAISSAQLPPFQTTITSTNYGDASLRRQKVLLEHALHQYVNQVCGNQPGDLLTIHMVDVFLQKGCFFKQTNLGRVLIPNWASIFQHIYNIRLTLLMSDPPAVVCIHKKQAPCGSDSQETIIDDGVLACNDRSLTLDDMIEMESQEFAHLERCTSVGYAVKHNATQTDFEGSLLPEAALDSLHDAKGPLYVGASSIQDFVKSIEIPSFGERDLQNLVDGFCRKVEEEKAEAAKCGGDEMVANFKTEHACPSLSLDGNHYRFSKDVSVVLKGARLLRRPNTYSWMSTDEVHNLTKLLDHCEKVQKELDEKLEVCLSMKDGF